jgi:antitoxin ParD1/3/4
MKETNKNFPMNTMNIAIPKQLKSFVQHQVERRGYSSVSEYVRDLIRGDQERQAITTLEAEFLKGLDSGPATPMTKQDWQDIREEIRRRSAARRKSA